MSLPAGPIVFKTEASLWEMMACGEKTWDARRWDLADERIYRLSWGHCQDDRRLPSRIGAPGRTAGPGDLVRKDAWIDGAWQPVEKEVSFVNKATGQVLTCEYLGMEFWPWAPGWCFLRLGNVS